MVETPVVRPLRVCMFATIAVAFFAVMNVFVKLSSEHHSIAEVMFFRNSLALVPVVMLMLLHPQQWQLFKTSRPKAHAIRGAVGMGSMTLFFLSFKLLPLANATALHFAMPIILTALSVPILKEVVGPWRWAAVVVGFFGILFIAAPVGAGATNWVGTIVALCAAFTSSITMMIIRKMGETEHALTIVFYFSLIGAVLSGLLLPWFWTPPSLSSFFYLIMCGLTGGAGQVFLTRAYAEGPAAYVAPFNYTAIIFATFFGWAIWGDVPDMHVFIGAGIIIASGLFILYRETVLKKEIVTDAMMDPAADIAPTEADQRDSGQQPEGMTYNPTKGDNVP